MRANYKIELRSSFQTMVGYAFIAFLVASVGIYFMVYNLSFGYPKFSYALYGSMYFFLIAVPVLTMRSMAEERKNKTDQLLLTRPVTLGQIVLGKYLAMITILAVPCGIFACFPLVIEGQGNAYLRADYASLLIYFLLGCMYIAVGLLMSSLTESPVIAAVSTFGILLVCYLWEGLQDFMPASAVTNLLVLLTAAAAVGAWIWKATKNWILGAGAGTAGMAVCGIVFLTDSGKFENLLPSLMAKVSFSSLLEDSMYNNILNLQGILLLLSVTGLCLFLTVQTIQKRRWN